MQTITMDQLDEMYENIDKMMSLKRYKGPTKSYFPSAAEINTYARDGKLEHILPYLLCLFKKYFKFSTIINKN